MATRKLINAIWWNIKINLQKLVNICGYELPTNLQNFTQKDLTKVKNIPKSFRGLLFSETPCRIIVTTTRGYYRIYLYFTKLFKQYVYVKTKQAKQYWLQDRLPLERHLGRLAYNLGRCRYHPIHNSCYVDVVEKLYFMSHT